MSRAKATRAKIVTWLVKKAVLNSYQHNYFVIVNSNNQELIHHIHCLGYAFYHHSKTKKFCLFHKFLFYDFYFECFLSNASNISYSTKHLWIHYYLFYYFYSHLWLFYSHYYHLLKTNASTSTNTLASIQQFL